MTTAGTYSLLKIVDKAAMSAIPIVREKYYTDHQTVLDGTAAQLLQYQQSFKTSSTITSTFRTVP